MSDLCTICGSDSEDYEWIQCDKCNGWVHFACLSIPRREVRRMTSFLCPDCLSSTTKSLDAQGVHKRRRAMVDYCKLQDGVIQTGKLHPYIQYFQSHRFIAPDESWECLPEEIPRSLDHPLKIAADNYSRLGMGLPPGDSLTVGRIARELGEETPVPVMDVITQESVPGWTLGQWRDYYETNASKRSKTYNVISLEISDTSLGKQIVRPKHVRDNDLVDKVYPEKKQHQKPQVRLYCLMSVKDSYTDFHIDFGGTSVFYHVVRGRKSFVFIRPTRQNLAAYERWCKSPSQQQTWFVSLVKAGEAIRIDLKAGDSMFIPSAWIHAVYTPEDSLVIGGNYLTLDHGEMQLAIDSLEQRTKVTAKYRFPKFRETMVLAANYYVDTGVQPSDLPLVKALIAYLEPQNVAGSIVAKLKTSLESNGFNEAICLAKTERDNQEDNSIAGKKNETSVTAATNFENETPKEFAVCQEAKSESIKTDTERYNKDNSIAGKKNAASVTTATNLENEARIEGANRRELNTESVKSET